MRWARLAAAAVRGAFGGHGRAVGAADRGADGDCDCTACYCCHAALSVGAWWDAVDGLCPLSLGSGEEGAESWC